METPPSTARASTKSRAVGNARDLLADEVTRLVRDHNYSERAAILLALDQAHKGTLDPVLQAALTAARDKRGRKSRSGSPLPSIKTLERILRRRRRGQSQLPEVSATPAPPQPWHAFVFERLRRPQKPMLTQIHAELVQAWQAEWGPKLPAYDTMRGVVREKFPRGQINAGRHTGSALRSLRPYTPRTAAGYLPFQMVMADGWKTHFRAPHPVTGELVTHEIWHFHDVATRYVTPVSVGRSESATVILKGIENCMRFGGRIRELYTDSTRCIKNDKIEFDPVASVSARAGFTLKHPVKVGNSQANGIAESFNRWLDAEARELPTYQNPAVMDDGAYTQINRWSGRQLRAAKRGDTAGAEAAKKQVLKHAKGGPLFSTYEEGLAWINARVDKFNRRAHRSLPKAWNPETQRNEHMSPLAKLQQFIEDGWQPLAVDEATLVDLFREHVRKRVTRGMVSPFNGQLYRHEALDAYTNSPGVPGEEVLVAIDPMDWKRVWVKTLDGQLICEAAFVAATGYSTLTSQEASQQKLMKVQIRGKEKGIDRIRGQMEPATVDMEALPAPELNAPMVVPPRAAVERVAEPLLPPPLPAGRRQAEPEQLGVIDTFLAIQAMEAARKKAREAAGEMPNTPPQAAAG